MAITNLYAAFALLSIAACTHQDSPSSVSVGTKQHTTVESSQASKTSSPRSISSSSVPNDFDEATLNRARERMAYLARLSIGTVEQNRSVWNEIQNRTTTCMRSSGFKYTPEPFDEQSISAQYNDPLNDGDSRELRAKTGYNSTGILTAGSEPTPPPPASPNQAYIQSLDEQSRVAFGEALYGDSTDHSQSRGGCSDLGQDELGKRKMKFLEKLSGPSAALSTSIGSDTRVVQAKRAWVKCMAQQGYEFAKPDDIPEHFHQLALDFNAKYQPINGVVSFDTKALKSLQAQERQAAVADWDCSIPLKKVNLIVGAEKSEKYIAEHEADLIAMNEVPETTG